MKAIQIEAYGNPTEVLKVVAVFYGGKDVPTVLHPPKK